MLLNPNIIYFLSTVCSLVSLTEQLSCSVHISVSKQIKLLLIYQ